MVEAQPQAETGTVVASEEELLAALRRGDEAAFAAVVDKHNSMLMRLAMMYVRRSIPFSSLGSHVAGMPAEPTVDPDRFLGPEHPRWPHHWRSTPSDWATMPENRLESSETLGVVEKAIEALAPAQREVITLRDLEGWTSDEVCNVLGITDTNQRVLLHRARSKVRRELERYLDEEKTA
jgi:RNA polymerase sigma-70 factor (ECF subfamily)